MCKLGRDGTGGDINKVLHWNGGSNGNKLCVVFKNSTNSNPDSVGIMSLNLENHLLPTFQKCLCIFYTLGLTTERPTLQFHSLASFKKRPSLHSCCATNKNGSHPPQNGCCQGLL